MEDESKQKTATKPDWLWIALLESYETEANR